MVGILVILALSWALLYFFEKGNLLSLGFLPIKKVLLQFVLGLAFIALIKLLFIYVETLVKDVEWAKNPSVHYPSLWNAFGYHLRSALTEDLVFRGALLYVFMKWLGTKWALWLSALAFGVYHWFSFGMLGSGVVPMAYVLIVTGITGYVWAYAFAKTRSIMMPLGFHLAWNYVLTLFYDSQPHGELLYKMVSKADLSEWNNLFFLLFAGLMPSLFTWLFVRAMVKRVPSLFVLGEQVDS